MFNNVTLKNKRFEAILKTKVFSIRNIECILKTNLFVLQNTI